MPYKANEARRHKIPKARYKIENWAAYDAALRRRGSLTGLMGSWPLLPLHLGFAVIQGVATNNVTEMQRTCAVSQHRIRECRQILGNGIGRIVPGPNGAFPGSCR